MTDMFPYELTEDEDEERYRWVKKQKLLEENRLYTENIKIKAINLFRSKNNKLELKKKANPILDEKRLTYTWINDKKKKGNVFKYRTRTRSPWEQIHFPYTESRNRNYSMPK
jgi:hypothetical protein